MSHLSDYIVIDQLIVHQLQVLPKQVKAQYTVTKGEVVNSTDLIFSYNQAYFDPEVYADVNLASMMVAQVALNYGLFCNEIIFDGIYEKEDQSFIREFMENTSREIITNKLLVDNEFIKEPYRDLVITKQSHYTAAQINFINTRYFNLAKTEAIEEKTKSDHYAILSSGGKDSLLSYGIVKELGVAHPVFINESGRHWFTAINAHRYFQETEPNTVKPWCNSDRLFNWVLKQLPFIKENFASIRADIYPIRLWTVAVFLFGVLPVVRKRKIGNVLIGNEFDTTVTGTRGGIKHYNGLYDQSIYFDRALSRYYQQKNWILQQYSLLRSLSELLIMKILVKRYPQLQKHQISCHAAHEDEGRMYPCGKCEKCRRIIGMLIALKENPERCGYSKEQIAYCLQQLEKRSVKQIGSDAAHLYHMLLAENALEKNEFTKRLAKDHPEIMHIRIQDERSPLGYLPDHIRPKVYNLFADYADGILEYKDRNWKQLSFENIN